MNKSFPNLEEQLFPKRTPACYFSKAMFCIKFSYHETSNSTIPHNLNWWKDSFVWHNLDKYVNLHMFCITENYESIPWSENVAF